MIDDGEKSHLVLVDDLKLTRETHKTIETKGLKDDQNPMNQINKVHRYFKKFMRAHSGYSRNDLQDWCNLFSFIYNHGGELQNAIKDILERAISTRTVVRYRALMSKK